MRLSWPSPLPTDWSTGRFAVGTVRPAVPGCADALPPPAAPLLPATLAGGVLLELLHAATAMVSAAMPAAITLAERPLLNLVMVLALPCPGDDRAGNLLGNREGLPFLPGDAHPRAAGPGPGQATGRRIVIEAGDRQLAARV